MRRELQSDQERDEHRFRNYAEQETTEDGACDRSAGHGEDEAAIRPQDLEAVVSAVSSERDQHGRQRHATPGEQEHSGLSGPLLEVERRVLEIERTPLPPRLWWQGLLGVPQPGRHNVIRLP
jgi:hypothetical protein